MKKIVCLILAAGEARRFGFPKQILPWRDTTILGYIVNEAIKADFYKVVIVLGAHYEKINLKLKKIFDNKKISIVYNREWEKGMFSSIKAGFSEILKFNADYTLVQLGDMPFVSVEIFNKFIASSNDEFDFIIAEESNKPAHPYMLSNSYIKTILNSNFKNGMKDFVKEHFFSAKKIKLDKVFCRQDIDTWDIYEKAKKIKKL